MNQNSWNLTWQSARQIVGVSPLLGSHMLLPHVVAALQNASVPPFEPKHVHVHGPGPVSVETADGVPTLQSPLVGLTPVDTPQALPPCPFMGGGKVTLIVRDGQLVDQAPLSSEARK